MKLLMSLFGLDARLRHLRILAKEGALAAEDRVQLLRLAWEEEKQRLRLMLILVIAVIGLTTIAVALLSVAVVVHFWDTPNRIAAAWSVAGVWTVLWLAAVVALISTLHKTSGAFGPARREFERDWEWAQGQFGLRPQEGEPPRESRRPATREELLARIERQRLRIATLQAASAEPDRREAAGEAPPPDESVTAAALRIAREHPIATGVAAAAAVAVLGPRRLMRWAVVVVPVLWRMR